MDRHDRLYENYEDALFALLMDKVAQEEGARLREENERLKNDPDAAVPESLDRKSRETIRRMFSAPRRPRHTAGWYVSRIAVAILIAIALFVTAYATIPSFQLRTLERLIRSSDVSSHLSFVFGENQHDDGGDAATQTLAGYAMPKLSEDYSIVDQGENDHETWLEFMHVNGSTIRFSVNMIQDKYFDNEDIVPPENIQINSYDGLLYEKGDSIYGYWYDSDHDRSIFFYTTGIDKEVTLSYIDQVVFVG